MLLKFYLSFSCFTVIVGVTGHCDPEVVPFFNRIKFKVWLTYAFILRFFSSREQIQNGYTVRYNDSVTRNSLLVSFKTLFLSQITCYNESMVNVDP